LPAEDKRSCLKGGKAEETNADVGERRNFFSVNLPFVWREE
jgi:hypothetical protein